ncbi:MAG: hypothetical protein AABX25_00295 [Nanoarchaeota archaeon]
MAIQNTPDTRLSRRQFGQAAAAGTAALALGPLTACTSDKLKSLVERIREFRGIETYPSISEYSSKEGISPVSADKDIAELLQREDIRIYISFFSKQNNVPAYLLAAIIAEENTPAGAVYGFLHGIGERFKLKLGGDTSLGIANVKLSTAAYYLKKIDMPSNEAFNRLSAAEKKEISDFLMVPRNNISIAARYTEDLMKSFIAWNNRNLNEGVGITNEEAPINPIALLQVANGYAGGEVLLDKSPNDKAKRVTSMITGNPFIMQAYGSEYDTLLAQSREGKKISNEYSSRLSRIKKLFDDSVDPRTVNQFRHAYQNLLEAYQASLSLAEDAASKKMDDWTGAFLAYAAYSQARAGYLSKYAVQFGASLSDSVGVRGNLELAISHYNQSLELYGEMQKRGFKPESFFVSLKGSSRRMPSRDEIQSVLTDIRRKAQ